MNAKTRSIAATFRAAVLDTLEKHDVVSTISACTMVEAAARHLFPVESGLSYKAETKIRKSSCEFCDFVLEGVMVQRRNSMTREFFLEAYETPFSSSPRSEAYFSA